METVPISKVVENLDAHFRFADAEQVLQYVNRIGMNREGIEERIGTDIEACHGESREKFLRLYREWAAGSQQVEVYTKPREGSEARKFDIMVPVHGPEGFLGVVEILFDAVPHDE